MSDPVTSPELLARLKKRFPLQKGYLLEAEITLADKKRNTRRADAIAIGLWPSTGLLAATGFEIKVSRQDWVRELDQIEKQEPLIEQCREFYLVVGDSKIVKDGELPEGWGFMVPSGERLRIARRSANNPEAKISEYALARFVERSHLFAPGNVEIEAARSKGFEKGFEAGKTLKSSNPKELEELRSAVATFERMSGVKINQWSGEHLGKEFKLARKLTGSYNSLSGLLSRVSHRGEDLKKMSRELSGELEALTEDQDE